MNSEENKYKNIPMVGLVGKNGFIESYNYKTARKYDFHHSFILSKEGEEIYHKDDTLRFVMYQDSKKYTLEGSPSLTPYSKGEKQIILFASTTA